MKTVKIMSYFINFLPFGIYLFIDAIMLFLEKGECCSIIYLVSTSILILIQVLSVFCTKYLLVKKLKSYPFSEQEYKIVSLKRDRANSLNFIITNVFPMIAFENDNLGRIIFVVIIAVVILIMFIKNNLFIYNPILEMQGIRIYDAILELSIQNVESAEPRIITKTIITKGAMALNSKIKFNEYMDDIVYYD